MTMPTTARTLAARKRYEIRHTRGRMTTLTRLVLLADLAAPLVLTLAAAVLA